MTCPNCGAEVGSNKYCEFCGSQITAEMQREQERLNKKGCPSCGSSNITFNREKQGEYRGKKGSAIVRTTVGLCKDCGYTWEINADIQAPKKRKTWLWVLGWIFLFPVPLTILLLRKKELKPVIKYGIIAVAWIVYFAIGLSGKSSDAENTNTVASTTQAEERAEDKTEKSGAASAFELEINAGELGDYGKELTLNAGTEFEDTTIGYFVPAGSYSVKNNGDYRTQVNVYKDEINVTSEGREEWADGISELIDVDETKEMLVEDGYFFNVDAPASIIITKIG